MRYANYLKAMGMGFGLSLAAIVPASAQSADPFDIAAAQLADGPESRAGQTEAGAGLMSVNLGPVTSDRSQANYNKLAAAFTKAYGPPPPQRDGVKVWDIPAKSSGTRYADITNVMLYISRDGNNMLKLDRRKPARGAPKPVQTPRKAKPAPSPVTRSQTLSSGPSVWDGQPD